MHVQPSATFNDLHGPGDLRDQRAVFNVFKMPVSNSEPHAARAVFQEANPSFFGPFVAPDISRQKGVVWTTHVTNRS